MKLKATSSAVTGEPSENFGLRAQEKRGARLSSASSAEWATSPYIDVRLIVLGAASSGCRTGSSGPAPRSPLRMNPLSVLKVMSPAVPIMDSRPPLGASGFDVVEMAEVGRVFEITERRQAVSAVPPATAWPEQRGRSRSPEGRGRDLIAALKRILAGAWRPRLLIKLRRCKLGRPAWRRATRLGRERRGSLGGQGFRECQSGPTVRNARIGRVPLRDQDSGSTAGHAVERAGRGHQLLAVLGEDDLVDQLIDRRVLDADQVAAAMACRRWPPSPRNPAARCPGESDCAQLSDHMMSKSNRVQPVRRYCEHVDRTRKRHGLTPSRSRLRL